MSDKLDHYNEVTKAFYFADAAEGVMNNMKLSSIPTYMKEKGLDEAYEYLKKACELLGTVQARLEDDISEDIEFSLENM